MPWGDSLGPTIGSTASIGGGGYPSASVQRPPGGMGARPSSGAGSGGGYWEILSSGKKRWISYATGEVTIPPTMSISAFDEVRWGRSVHQDDNWLFSSWKTLAVGAAHWFAGFATGRGLVGAIAGKPMAVKGSALMSPMRSMTTSLQVGISGTVSVSAQVASIATALAPVLDDTAEASPGWTLFLGGMATGAYSLARGYWQGMPERLLPTAREATRHGIEHMTARPAEAVARDFFSAGRAIEDWFVDAFSMGSLRRLGLGPVLIGP